MTSDPKLYSFIYLTFIYLSIYVMISYLVKIPFLFNLFQLMIAIHYLSDKTRLNYFLHIHIVLFKLMLARENFIWTRLSTHEAFN